jgi:hypothetical protein
MRLRLRLRLSLFCHLRALAVPSWSNSSNIIIHVLGMSKDALRNASLSSP